MRKTAIRFTIQKLTVFACLLCVSLPAFEVLAVDDPTAIWLFEKKIIMLSRTYPAMVTMERFMERSIGQKMDSSVARSPLSARMVGLKWTTTKIFIFPKGRISLWPAG